MGKDQRHQLYDAGQQREQEHGHDDRKQEQNRGERYSDVAEDLEMPGQLFSGPFNTPNMRMVFLYLFGESIGSVPGGLAGTFA